MQPAAECALELIDITKSFGSFKALDRAHFTASYGQVHALLGENGAGKSSLMNVAAGLYSAETGRMRVDGRDVLLSGPAGARAACIGMVHQHFKLVKSFTVAENIVLGIPKLDLHTPRRALHEAIESLAANLGFAIDLSSEVGALSVGAQQRVEILKVLMAGARVLILDEPTAVLTDQEAHALLSNIRRLAEGGTAVVLVTHKLREVQSYCDRVSVMRRGRTVATLADPKAASRADLAELVVGADVTAPMRRSAARRGRSRLYVADLCCRRDDGFEAVRNASFHVRDGEIYGIAGVSGNGQQELVEVLMGLAPAASGAADMAAVGNLADLPASARAHGQIAAIPADRYALGLAASLSVEENFGIGQVRSGRFGGWAWVERGAMRAAAEEAIAKHDIHGVHSLGQPAALLSGGNAQKLVLARELAASPALVMAHNPSRGLDVRACAAVHRHLLEASDAGAAVLLLSEDLEEILALSDRIGVMARGEIVAEFEPPFDRLRIGQAMVASDGR